MDATNDRQRNHEWVLRWCGYRQKKVVCRWCGHLKNPLTLAMSCPLGRTKPKEVTQ